jgi:hypothetical protein
MFKACLFATALLAAMCGIAAADDGANGSAERALDTGKGKFFQKLVSKDCDGKRRCDASVVSVPRDRQLLLRFIGCGATGDAEHRVAFLIAMGPNDPQGVPLAPVQRSVNDSTVVSQMVHLSVSGQKVAVGAVSDGPLTSLACTVSGEWVR